MALTSPLTAAEFVQGLAVRSARFWIERYDEVSGTAGGQILKAQIALPKWRAEIELHPRLVSQASQVRALVHWLEAPGRLFHCFNPAQPFPAADPSGSILGSAEVVLHSIGANNRSCRLGGLPGGYVITRGDLFHFNYGSNPARRALVEAVETVTASGGGLTPFFDISGHFPAGATAGLAVSLRRPAARMTMVPGSFRPGTSVRVRTEGMAFEAIEVIL